VIGVGVSQQSIGEYTYKGVDLAVAWDDRCGDFDYGLYANGGWLFTMVIDDGQAYEMYDYLYRKGNPVGQRYGLEVIGIFQNQVEINNSPQQTFGTVRPGDLKYRDQNGDEHDIYNVDELNIPFERPQLYNWKNEKEMLDSLKTWTAKDNGEGVVVVDKNFNRVKIKTEDYRRIKFESNSNDYGDNRLFRYFAAGEIDDLVAVNPELLPRIEVFRAKLKELDNKLAEWKAIADNLNYVYRDKQALHLALNSKYSGWEKVFIRRLLKQTPEEVKDFLLHGKNGWWKASTPFTERCEIVGK
jgi:hypothetical protein